MIKDIIEAYTAFKKGLLTAEQYNAAIQSIFHFYNHIRS
jgi:hypothetical protein